MREKLLLLLPSAFLLLISAHLSFHPLPLDLPLAFLILFLCVLFSLLLFLLPFHDLLRILLGLLLRNPLGLLHRLILLFAKDRAFYRIIHSWIKNEARKSRGSLLYTEQKEPDARRRRDFRIGCRSTLFLYV